MRILNFLFVACLFTLAISCSEDNAILNRSAGEAINEEDFLIGDWTVTAINYSGTSQSIIDGEASPAIDFVGTGTNMDLSLQLENAPKTYTAAGDYSIRVTYDFGGQSADQTWTNQNFLAPGTWSKIGDLLTVTSPDHPQPQSVRIVEMDDTSLILSWEFERTQTQTLDGSTFKTILDIAGTYTFVKEE